MKPIIYYGQNREDIILSAFFSDIEKGFYVDVGAYHPVQDSVTKYFYDQGWSGINIEPQPKQSKQFEKSRPRDVNMQLGAASEAGELKLRQYDNGGLSTFSGELKGKYEQQDIKEAENYTDVTVPVDTLASIFIKQQVASIQFLKVDAEGFEHEVLSGNDWEKFRPEVLCIESDHISKDWHELLQDAGYQQAFFDGLNEYFVSQESVHRIELFKTAFPALLTSAPLISYSWKQHIDKLERQLQKVQKALVGQIASSEQLQQVLQATSIELEKYYSTKYLFKQLVERVLAKTGFKRR